MNNVNEASLSRVYSHINNKDIPVAIITAFRGSFDDTNVYHKNVWQNKKLAQKVREAKYGYFFVEGYWHETDEETGEKGKVKEDSIFIVGDKNDNGRLKGLLRKWIKEFNQEAAVFKPEGTNNGTLIFQDGNEVNIGKFSASSAEDSYSKMRHGNENQVFTFVSERNDLGVMSRMAKKAKEQNTPASLIRETMSIVEKDRMVRPNTAYWISPRGEILDTSDAFHIGYVLDNPEKFGLTDEYIKKVHDKYGENVGGEGKGREEIIKELSKKGWIRIRLYASRNISQWSVTVGNMTRRVKDIMQSWAEKQMNVDSPVAKDKYMPVVFTVVNGSKPSGNLTVQDIAQDKLFNEQKRYALTIVENIKHFPDLFPYDFVT